MEDWNFNGFRICIEMCLPGIVESKKCFIFVDKQWSKIKHVQEHIKDVFDIEENINLFVEDVLLPENETIQLIQLNDILVVKPQVNSKKKALSNKQTYQMWIPLEEHMPPDFIVKTKVKDSQMVPCSKKEDSADKVLSDCLQELRSKREQLEKANNFDLPSVPSVSDTNETERLFEIPSSKKRKRKHKKKNKFEINGSYEDTQKNNSDLITFDSLESSNKHIHFADDLDDNFCAHSSPKDVSTIDEMHTKLIELVKKPSLEKNFSRNTEVSAKVSETVQVTEPNHVTVASKKNDLESNGSEVVVPKIGNLIAFKKIKLGNDYTPQESNEILGEVMDVQECDGSRLVVFKIKEGTEEFTIPSGKFSMELDEDICEKNGDKICVAELHWHEVLSPRLINKV